MNVILNILVFMNLGWVSVFALFLSYFFMSIMFPTIFALGINNLGTLTKKGSSFLVMAVAGGAFCPPLMGLIADHSSMATGFIIPVLCYVVIAIFAIWGVGKVEGKLDMSNPVH
jgi:FHS family L-fucose permease-like MFS transporter